MTQAFNLSQLANNLNTAGQLDATDGLTGEVPLANLPTITVAKGGTGQNTLSANAVILGNGTSGVQTVAPSTSGNVLVSNGTTWVSQAPAGGGVTSLNGQTGAITNTGFNVIGSYVIAGFTDGNNYGNIIVNQTTSGSNINKVNGGTFQCGSYALFANQNISLSGTWRSLGATYFNNSNQPYVTWLWVRIS